ncbi:fluoride efflux transporter CrcB [Paenibacillus sp. P96]|uniref:Fluoride-specific ion channel FluC n=1 Tax=Paenibacillus zeirhizosphaerae TaxID=2987519 RepID=A0ABT9FL08_9BACL|nr:fluoride efflux transporter CrcB [Paenibacillus sp. P96]MDP4095216.1 fluoride efflux transporter CrcB [Paenibacillus sp. P96]
MKDLIFVGAGGLIGTLCRYAVQQWFPVGAGGFPLPVLLVNLSGCLFLGWFFTVTPGIWRIPPRLRLALGTGFTGAFTTFSTFTVDALRLWGEGEAATSLLYILLSLLGGLLMSLAGIRLGQNMATRSGGGTAV